ncbi:hypothetical protein V6N13_009622 [Hibiscus sabdariffa]|uniref:Pectinesterase inhibitor domain-containing protein n=1 Tax=Hibiscus sabdariffa TaxID=183260 RepID=A0ABR2NNS1_9ROSI
MVFKASALCTIAILLFLFSTSLYPASVFNSESIFKLTLTCRFLQIHLTLQQVRHHSRLCRVSGYQSLLNAHSILGSIKYFLRLHSTSCLGTTRALQDCLFLVEVNVDFLSHTLEQIKSDRLNTFMADDLHCLLSAVLTNVQICVKGLEAIPPASSCKHGLSVSFTFQARLGSWIYI